MSGVTTRVTQELDLRTWLRHLPGAAVRLGSEAHEPRTSSGSNPWDSTEVDVRPTPLPAHVGLWLDRCLVEPPPPSRPEADKDKTKPGRAALYRTAIASLESGTPARGAYQPAFNRWKKLATEVPSDTHRRVIELKALSRIQLHSATTSSVTEGSLLLHHTYGVPYLPGSALKGICRARALRLSRLFPERYRALLGLEGEDLGRRGMDQEPTWLTELLGYVERGEEGGLGSLVDFWDALWIPEGPSSPLALDIVNPHHSRYYTGKHLSPLPNEEPIPTQFLTIAPGTRFLLVLEVAHVEHAEDWLQFVAEELLLPALELDGIGSRTSSGYGRLAPATPQTPRWGPGAAGGSGDTSGARGPGAGGGVEPGMVSRTKGDGTLRASLATQPVAEVRRPRAQELYEQLSPDVRLRLDKGKPQRLLIRWKPVGNARVIEDISEG